MEEEVHNEFYMYRMMRDKPRDSEWFDFEGRSPLDTVRAFMNTRSWVKREVPESEICPKKRPPHYVLKKQLMYKNLKIIKTLTERDAALNREQVPVEDEITRFLKNPDERAAYVIAPCGFGKTKVTVGAAKGVIKKAIICCPSNVIQNQWHETLLRYNAFANDNIHIISSYGTTDVDTISRLLENDVYCIITTYMSSHLLVDMIRENIELLVLDEAHHMVGVVASEENKEGRTRRLLMKAVEIGIKRLSLTYTPRFIVNAGDTKVKYLTMDDDSVFGKKIVDVRIRDIIKKGILPDYRVWSLRDKHKKGRGLIGKAECLLEAWNATHIVRGEERNILHHLIVYALNTEDAKMLEDFFKEKIEDDTVVIRVEGGDKLEEPIERFTRTRRAIIVNCFVLNEGVDIPIADSVAIMYPKQSRGQITQMVLRPGRWYEGKAMFYILLPSTGDEDLSGFEEVLTSLASIDENIRDEIVMRARSGVKPTGTPTPSDGDTGTEPEMIMIDEFEADEEQIKKCFENIRKNMYPKKNSMLIQELCIRKGIDTSRQYNRLLEDIPELPEDPRPKNVTWYSFLHPSHTQRIPVEEFVANILEPNNLRLAHNYVEWLGTQALCRDFPTIEYITDGFFGTENTHFKTLLEKYGRVSVRCRR